MRILQVCQPVEGGVFHYVKTLSRGLKARGWSVDVACPPGTLADRLQTEGIGVWSLPMAREISPRRDLATTLRLWKIIRGEGYSVVHTHSSKAGAVGRVAGWLARTPTIHTPNAWSFLAAGSTFERHLYIAAERILAFLCSRIICVSSEELDLGRRTLIGERKKLRLVPNGVRVPPERVSRSSEGDLVVGSLTRLARQKGIDYLVQAAELVCAERRGDGVRFSVAGGGPDFERLKGEVQRRGLSGRFHLLGPVQDPWGYLAGIDIFVLPSLWEGMPFALLEAMGYGLPVVVTDVGGVRDAIPDVSVGTIVHPADPGALKEAILRYVESPRLRDVTGTAARERVIQEFSQERMIERTLQVYSEVLKH